MTARILIIDSSAAVAGPLAQILSAEYYQVAVAPSERPTPIQTGFLRPDLIAIDLTPPCQAALSVCAGLKRDPSTRGIALIGLTGPDGAADGLRALQLGADDYLVVPDEIDLVCARVRSLVRRKRLADELGLRRETALALGLAADWLGDAAATISVAGTRALVIDSDDARAAALQRALTDDGVLAARARSEADALALTAVVQFHLIVLGATQHGADTLHVASRLRAAEATQSTPILVALGEPERRQTLLRGLDLGVSDWLRHPADGDELRARARNQIRQKVEQDRLRADFEHALALALTDPLTELHNQRYLSRHLASLLEAGQPDGIAVLMIDVDHFKLVNDRYGHAVGDRALRAVAERLSTRVRVGDSIARYGGEEFVVLMPCTGLTEALGAAERLRSEIEAMEFAPVPGRVHRMTISIGVASGSGAQLSGTALLQSADQAMYRAKQCGRNRVEVAPSLLAPASAT